MSINWKISRFAQPEDSIGYLLWQVTHAWQRQLEQALAALDLTHLQFVLLAGIGWLTRNGDLVTQVELAEFCQIDVMQISQVVRKLEAKQLIQRTTHPTDTRAKVLRLNPIGETKLQAALPLVERLDADFFSIGNPSVLLVQLQCLHGSRSDGLPLGISHSRNA
jgi:DNA-binding MarR family transcriptional regulator